MQIDKHLALLSMRLALRVIIFFATNLVAQTQSATPQLVKPTSIASYDAVDSQPLAPAPSSVSGGVLLPNDGYHSITPGQRFQWFVTSTIGPSHLAGVAFTSGCGAAAKRPAEYGPRWKGYATRFGSGATGSAVGNGLEAGAGFFLREDPRYFRAAQLTFRGRVGNVMQRAFSTRSGNGRLVPAYARFLGIVGGNFLSNTWRVPSEANSRDALLRSSEGFAGRMAANAFHEFWPDLKKHAFRQRGQGAATKFRNGH